MLKVKSSCNEVYDLIFDPVFLTRYGYYDISIKDKRMLSNSINIDNDYGQSDSFYFKVFNMECFADYLKNNDLKKHFKINKPKENKSTEPVYFSIPKNLNSRRQYKMPNLYSYLALAYFICENKNEFTDIFLNNKFSTSKFFNQLNFDFKTTQEIKQVLLYGGVKRLNLDLSNFYHTLYTHSIPWIIKGKDQAKKDKSSGFANHLDKFTTLCQYDETHGIPTGNLLSRIIAELYLCYFDKKMEEKGFVYARYVDDFNFSFSLDAERENFLKSFNFICREHNLLLNDKKTSIDDFPFVDNLNKTNLFSFFNSLNSKTTAEKWVREINSFVDYCLNQEYLGNKGSIKAMFPVIVNTLKRKKVSSYKVNSIFSHRNSITGFNIFEKILDLSLKNSSLTNRFLGFFEEISALGFSNKKASSIVKGYFKNNKKKYKDKIAFYADNHLNQELYQILLYVVQFEVKTFLRKRDLLSLINKQVDDFSLILATIIYLTKKNCSINELLTKIDNLFSAVHSDYPKDNVRMSEKLWLFRYFFYYISMKGIITKKELNSYCKSAKYKSGKKGYETELNWKYIRNNPKPNNIDDFYDDLLQNNVWLVNCGENDDFKYLSL